MNNNRLSKRASGTTVLTDVRPIEPTEYIQTVLCYILARVGRTTEATSKVKTYYLLSSDISYLQYPAMLRIVWL